MRIFVTGATGFIGGAVTEELIRAGHSVTALARTEAAAEKLAAKGIRPHPGRLDDLESLRSAAGSADGVIHLAFMHGLGQAPWGARLRIFLGGLPSGIALRFIKVATDLDRRAIAALGAALQGSGRPLVTTFGTMGLAWSGPAARPATEQDPIEPRSPGYIRAETERTVEDWASRGVRTSMIRLAPSVHGDRDTGLVPQLIGIAAKKKVSAYVDDGANRWPAVHRRDAAVLFRLALERGEAGARYHGVAEEGVPFRSIAEVIGRRLGLPVVSRTAEQAAGQFSWFSPFVAVDNPASSEATRRQLGWHPKEAGLLADLDRPAYFSRTPS